MQVSVEAGEGLERRMKVDLPFEQIEAEVEKRLQKLARTTRLPGFRPGKVPLSLLRRRFAGAVQQEVLGEMVESSFTEALARESLHPAGPPRVEPELLPEEQRIGFTATFEVLPKIEVADLSARVVKSPTAEVTEADLENMIERLRRQRATWQPVDRASQMGDRLTVSFMGTVDGEAFEGGSGTGIEIDLGKTPILPGFAEALTGVVAGEQRAVDLVFPEDYRPEHLAGKPAHFEVTVEAVAELELPAVDADLAKAMGIEDGDLERFHAEVRKNVEREMRQRLAARRKDAALEVLLAAHDFELPKVMVEAEIRAMNERMGEMLGSKTKLSLPPETFEPGARRRVALGLIIGEIVRQQGLKPDAARVRAIIEETASTYDQPSAVVEYYYRDPKRLLSIESLDVENQVVDWVMQQAQVEEEVLSFAQLTEPVVG